MEPSDQADLGVFEHAMDEQRYDEALRLAQEAHEEYRDDLTCLLALARAHYRTKQFSEALYWASQLDVNLWDEANETGLTDELTKLYVNGTSLLIMAQCMLNQMNPVIRGMDDLAISGPSILGPSPNRAELLPMGVAKSQMNMLSAMVRQLMGGTQISVSELGIFFDACQLFGVRVVD